MKNVITLTNKENTVNIIFPRTSHQCYEIYLNCKFQNALQTKEAANAFANILLGL